MARDLTGTIRRRRRRLWRRRLIIAAAVAATLALIGAAVWAVFFSSLLTVRQVKVTGISYATKTQVVEAAQVPVGQPLARIDTDAIAARVEQLPQVASADVSRAWPHVAHISVTERTAVYAWRRGSEFDLVDATGAAFHRVGTAPKKVMVATVPADLQVRADVAVVVAALPDDWREGTIGATDRDDITIVLPDGRTVAWGSADQTELKREVAEDLLAAVDARVYDVSAPSRPVTR